jgi:hypothetical protein
MDRYLEKLIETNVDVKYNLGKEHIFVVGAYTDTLEKQIVLVKCINRLKEFGSTIVLCSHLDVDVNIQKIVDYYIYDDRNELLYFDEARKLNLDNVRYINTDSYTSTSCLDFNHDYAVLTNIKNGFNLALNLGKKIIHYIEYDNIIETLQYYQTFISDMNYYDASLYEYCRGSVSNGYSAAYIFSIRCDIAEKMINDIGTLEEHFSKKDWRLENYILNSIRAYTNNIKVSNYIDNNKSLNICYLFNREILNELYLSLLVVDDNRKLYFSFFSKKENFIEIKYNNYSKFVKVFGYQLVEIGEYLEDSTVYLKYMGKTFFEKRLSDYFEVYKKKNFIVFK